MRATRHVALTAVVALTLGGAAAAGAADPIVVVVTTTADVVDAGDGEISLREAVVESNGVPGAYIIELAADTYLLESELFVGGAEADLTIRGVGMDTTVIDAQGGSRLFRAEDATLAIEDLALTGGQLTNTGGAAIVARDSTLVLDRAHLHDNQVRTDTLAGGVGAGAVLVSTLTGTSRLEIADSLFARNSVVAETGMASSLSAGAVDVGGETTFAVYRTRFTDNSVTAFADDQPVVAGAFSTANLGEGLSIIEDSTFDGNDLVVPPGHTAFAEAAALLLHDNDGDTIGHEYRTSNLTFEANGASTPSASTVWAWNSPMVASFVHMTLRAPGVGLDSGAGVVELANSVIDAAGADCAGATPTSMGGNVISDTTCGAGLASDSIDTAPGLGAFDTTTTPVPVVRLDSGAAAIDQAVLDEIIIDARGLPRPAGATPDSGAFEHQAPAAVDDVAATDADTSVAIDVTSNDMPGDAPLGTVTISSAPTSGAAEVGTGGTVTFTPSGAGVTTFGYQVCQQGFALCDTAQVTVTVDPTDDPTDDPTEDPTEDPTDDPTDDPTEQGVVRRSGGDRYDTAVLASRAAFAPGVDVAYVATGETFPDALAGAPLAARDGAPILLTRQGELPEVTVAELDRLAPERIVVLGGPVAVSSEVESALADHTPGTVTRLDGPDRYATAARIAEEFGDTGGPAYLATGTNFPDALAGAAAAGRDGAPILLVSATTVPPATADQLTRLAPTEVVALGGTAVVSDDVLAAVHALVGVAPIRIAGGDRYATAAEVARTFDTASTVYVATGLAFPDALAGAPIAGAEPAPILLTDPLALPAAAVAQLERLAPTRIVVLGGESAVSAGVAAVLAEQVGD